MARYIDADKAKQEFNIGFGGVSHAVIANQIIDSVPTADVEEVKHGEWKMNFGRGYGEKLYFCSLCVEGDSDTGHDNYCPYCGAKMDGGKAE